MIYLYEFTSINGQPLSGTNKILYRYKNEQFQIEPHKISSYETLAHKMGIDGFEILFSASKPGDITLLARKTIVPQQPFGELEERLNARIDGLKDEFIPIGESVVISDHYELWKDGKNERIIFNNGVTDILINLPKIEENRERLKDWVFYFCWVKGGKRISFDNDIYFNQAGSLHKKREFLPSGDGSKSTTLKITFLEGIGYFLID